ncbi:S1 RNA-binding domain-containing protein [Synechococcus sp. H65.1]|uniref:S1 RNA-binding domain-containing protein n=1 Tax=unclassified Synechococcus TaxID=2626047 RepID=UPI0039C29565
MTLRSPRSPAAETFSVEDFAQALAAQSLDFRPGQVVRGRIFQYQSDGIWVDIGAKSPAFLPLKEAGIGSEEDLSQLFPLKSEAEFLILKEDAAGQILLSARRLRLRRLWEELAEKQARGEVVTAPVIGINKGGVVVDVQGLRGFIPRSHLLQRGSLEELVGQLLTASLLEVNPAAKKLVLSERVARQAESLGIYTTGQVVRGKVSALKPFGVFVELEEGGSGLLPIKQVSQSFVASLSDLFQPGQPIKAVVIDVDEAKGRIALSLRVLERYPGEALEQLSTLIEEAEERARKLKGRITPDGKVI